MTRTSHPTFFTASRWFSVLCLVFIGIVQPLWAQELSASPEGDEFHQRVYALVQSSLMKRSDAIEALAEIQHERTDDVLAALLEGRLYAGTDEPPRVALQKTGGSLFDAFTNEAVPSQEGLKRIPVTNRMRGQLRDILARLNIRDSDPSVRYSAVQRIISEGINFESAELLRQHQQEEKNVRVSNAIKDALSLYRLQSTNSVERLAAIEDLHGSLQQEVRNELRRLQEYDPDDSVQLAASDALESIASRIKVYKFTETVFFGLSLGSVLLLAAIGLAITFGVMGVINMAHGELMMIGAYTTWVIQQLMPNHIGWSLAIAVPAAFMVSGLVGIAIERGVIRFLYGRPLETLLATFGISLILQQAARTIFSPLNRSVVLPEWMSGSLEINPVLSLTYNRLYILLFGLAVFFLLMLILKRTSLGLKVRAVSQNRSMARAVGVRANWVDALTFGLGSGIAGIAGVALSQLTNVGPNLGQAYIIDSFMVVVFGGVGNLWGTLVGAMSLGVLNKFMEPFAGAVLAKVLVLVMLILFIQKRPRGLFPQTGRAAE